MLLLPLLLALLALFALHGSLFAPPGKIVLDLHLVDAIVAIPASVDPEGALGIRLVDDTAGVSPRLGGAQPPHHADAQGIALGLLPGFRPSQRPDQAGGSILGWSEQPGCCATTGGPQGINPGSSTVGSCPTGWDSQGPFAPPCLAFGSQSTFTHMSQLMSLTSLPPG